jgi:hypothetical protein
VGSGQYTKEGIWSASLPHEVGSWILTLEDATLGKIERPYQIKEGETTVIDVKASEFPGYRE